MSQEYRQCLICSSKVVTRESINTNSNLLNTDSTLLSKNLDVIFVLRKLLNVPISHLVHQLKECGSDDPRNWIRLCDQCTQLTRKANGLDQKKRRCVQKQVVKKMISSKCSQRDYDKLKRKAYHNRKSLTFEDKIRSFVKTYNYTDNLDDTGEDHNGPGAGRRFLEGDKLAKYLLESQQRNSSASQILLVEEPVIPEIDIESEEDHPQSPPSPVDIEVTPPSSPKSSDDDNEYIIKTKVKRKRETSPKLKQKRNNLKCPHCLKIFKTRQSVTDHIKFVHFKDFKIFCPICQQGFCHNQQKARHMLTTHKDDPLTVKLQEEEGLYFKRCPIARCGASFLTKEQEDKHMKNKHSGEEIAKVTEEETGDTEDGKRKRINGDGQVWCDDCGKWYSNWLTWKDHVWKNHEGSDISCPGGAVECGYKFKVSSETLGEFKEHFEADHEPEIKKLSCNICGKEMLTREMIRIHKGKEHHSKQSNEDGPWQCDICGKEKTSYTTLYFHRKRAHKVNMKGEPLYKDDDDEKLKMAAKRVPCSICGKEYSDKDTLRKHVKRVHQKEIIQCELCGLEVEDKRKLRGHMTKVHRATVKGEPLEEKPKKKGKKKRVMCSLCGKELSEQYKLTLHIRNVHERQFDFNCHVCGEGKPSKRELYIHLFRQHKDDPVTRNLEEEEGFRLIRCEVTGCTGKYLRMEELEKHMEKMHKEGAGKEENERFKCEICGRGFFLMTKLKSHVNRVHEKKMGRKVWNHS